MERHLVRNYLLDQTQIEEVGVQWLQDQAVATDINHLEWALGVGIEIKESLMIQHKTNLETNTSAVQVRSKLKPLGNAIQLRHVNISEQILQLLLAKFNHQVQEKIVYSVTLEDGGIMIEQQPTSLLTLEFTGSRALEYQQQFMQSQPGLIPFRKSFKTQFAEFQSLMGIQQAEQRALNSLTFAQALQYNNFQSTPAFITRLQSMARAAIQLINRHS